VGVVIDTITATVGLVACVFWIVLGVRSELRIQRAREVLTQASLVHVLGEREERL
jgi:hypothetical protein